MAEFYRECVACVVVRSETGAAYTESRGCGVMMGSTGRGHPAPFYAFYFCDSSESSTFVRPVESSSSQTKTMPARVASVAQKLGAGVLTNSTFDRRRVMATSRRNTLFNLQRLLPAASTQTSSAASVALCKVLQEEELN